MKVVRATHERLGTFRLYCDGADELLFTENETNYERLFGTPNASPYVKDGINESIVAGKAKIRSIPAESARNARPGTRSTCRRAKAGRCASAEQSKHAASRFDEFDDVFERRIAEADEFYRDLNPFP